MLSWFQALMPREEKFFDLFARHAQTSVGGAHALRDLLNGGPGVAAACARILQFENDADIITGEVMLAVRRTFITPFDRGDIQDLITSMDDAIDQMQKTAKAITIFELNTFDATMREMGDIVVQAADLAVQAIDALRHMRKDAAKISAIAGQMKQVEEHSDQLHDNGIRDMYRAHRHDDPMAFVVGTEILGHLEKVVDRFEDVANRVNAIVIEHL
jgi:predicted phosphate transport protein (TIGR00153 family)